MAKTRNIKNKKKNKKTRKITSKASVPKKGKTPIIISKSIKSLPRKQKYKKDRHYV